MKNLSKTLVAAMVIVVTIIAISVGCKKENQKSESNVKQNPEVLVLLDRIEAFQKLRLSAAANAGDHLNVRRAHNVFQFVQIMISFDQSHIYHLANIITFYFAKSRVFHFCEAEFYLTFPFYGVGEWGEAPANGL